MSMHMKVVIYACAGSANTPLGFYKDKNFVGSLLEDPKAFDMAIQQEEYTLAFNEAHECASRASVLCCGGTLHDVQLFSLQVF
jgi:hypothetical protein